MGKLVPPVWIMVVDDAGFQQPLRAYALKNGMYLCDQIASLDKRKLIVEDLEEFIEVSEDTPNLIVGIYLERLPLIQNQVRRWYASVVDFKKNWREEMAALYPEEYKLRDRLLRKHLDKLRAGQAIIIEEARTILTSK